MTGPQNPAATPQKAGTHHPQCLSCSACSSQGRDTGMGQHRSYSRDVWDRRQTSFWFYDSMTLWFYAQGIYKVLRFLGPETRLPSQTSSALAGQWTRKFSRVSQDVSIFFVPPWPSGGYVGRLSTSTKTIHQIKKWIMVYSKDSSIFKQDFDKYVMLWGFFPSWRICDRWEMGSHVSKTKSLNISNVIYVSLRARGSLAKCTNSHSRIVSGRAEVCFQTTGSSSYLGLHLLAMRKAEGNRSS